MPAVVEQGTSCRCQYRSSGGPTATIQVPTRSRRRHQHNTSQTCPVHAQSQHQCRATATMDAPQASAFADVDHFAVPDTTPAFPRSDFEKDSNDLELLCNSNAILQPPMSDGTSSNMDWQADMPGPCSSSGRGLPVYVMLPLDTVWVVDRGGTRSSMLKREKALSVGLRTLKQAGVEGVMVDVWWGVVERDGPGCYDFTAYRRLFEKIRESGLKVQAVMSFHAAGGNVGDTCRISLPRWVHRVGEANPDIYYTDIAGHRNRECISLGCDQEALFDGRTPLDIYRDFIEAFADGFQDLFGSMITEVTIGLGPAGELRYPAYPEGDGRWRFPGVGEFQCYDSYMLRHLAQSAATAGHPEWGYSGPHDAGHYNSQPGETGFFRSQEGNWDTEYGRFFLDWYSGQLLQHADRILGVAAEVLGRRGPLRASSCAQSADGCLLYKFEPACQLGIKLAGVHWWFKSRAHAAELTAGYYNTRERDGYGAVLDILERYQARLSFTCVEMRDCEHPNEARCSPQGLLQQIIETCIAKGVQLAGENALQRYDDYAFDRIAESAVGQNARAGRLEQLTFLRMGDLMFDNWAAFSSFLARLRTPPSNQGLMA
ncbi:hypothetical protein WJX74_006952 [Apatococcus lobatus]|uniref:Beta-amylase n=1 Tax=Apatococcus lobatus TaxID=904363 RepID=A0AAW1R3I0_9CHLO